MAFVGIGGRGGGNLDELTTSGSTNVVSICDVNGGHLDRVGERFPKARRFADFRRMFDDLKDVDAVVVSTTEHTHAFATLPALQLGKHVYCEKPLTHNIGEARKIMLAAEQAKVATQMGTQIHGMPNYRRVVELIQSGAIGAVTEAHVWTSRAWGLQSQEEAQKHGDIVYVTDRPTEEMVPPPNLDWDLWIGPAPMRPYHEVYFPGPKWYRWWDFGSGTMSDLGSHFNDLPFWALKLDSPKTIEAIGQPPHRELAPASMTAIYEYGPRGDMPACKVTWYQGTHKPQIWKDGGIPNWNDGMLFIGDKGMVLSDYFKHVLLPRNSSRTSSAPSRLFQIHRTAPRVAKRHHERHANRQPIQLRWIVDDRQSSRQCRLSNQYQTRMGSESAESHQLSSCRPVHPPNTSRRLDTLITKPPLGTVVAMERYIGQSGTNHLDRDRVLLNDRIVKLAIGHLACID